MIYPDVPCNNVRTLVIGEEVLRGDLLYRTFEQKWEPVSFDGHKVLADEVGIIYRSLVVPPRGSRLLHLNETVASGDLVFDLDWTPVSMIGRQVKLNDYGNFARFLSVEMWDKAIGETKRSEGVNPKDAVAAAKPDLYLVPPALIIWVAKCMENGAKKYSPANWRDEDKKVRMTVYISAALRHLMALADGEDNAPDSKLPHAAHAAASMGIILDALACGTLIDDRSRPGPAAKLLEQLTKKPND